MASNLATLDANLERILFLEQQTSTARAQTHEALCNLLQSRTELSTAGAMLSAATRAAMGKRGISQLETTKGLLDMAADTAALVRGDATALREEVASVVAARDAAVARVAEAEAASAEVCERVEAEGAAAIIATNEATTRAEQAAAATTARAEAAELRAEQAERGFVEAEKERAEAVAGLAEAHATRDDAVTKLASCEEQLARERSVLARVMAENVLFVKKTEFAEAERQKALDEKEALRVKWRDQTEEWFSTAATELQSRLLKDWGAAELLQEEIATSRQEKAKTDAQQRALFEEVSARELAMRTEAQSLAAEREALLAERAELQAALAGAREEVSSAERTGQQLQAQADVRAQQVEELKSAEKEWRAKGEASAAASLELRGLNEERAREVAQLREALAETEGKLRVTTKVSERVRAESVEEHSKMLEMQAKLETLQEHYDVLVRQNSFLVGTKEGLVAGA